MKIKIAYGLRKTPLVKISLDKGFEKSNGSFPIVDGVLASRNTRQLFFGKPLNISLSSQSR